MGGVTLPTANTPGYGSITRNGRTYVGCDCTIEFLEAGEALGLAAGRLREGLDIVQLTGNAAASGGVHRLGAAFDVKQFDSWWTRVWREMGASFWPRLDPNPGIPGDLWDGNEHGHGGIDCPHNSLIAYQNLAYRRGYNGLGQATSGPYAGQWGYGAKDPTFRPAIRRTWQQGIAWANAETARLKAEALKTELAAQGGLSMADINTLTAQLDALTTAVKGLRSEEAGRYQVATGRHGWIAGALNNIAGKVGVDVDEQAIADSILTGLAPTVRQAVIDAGQPEAVADAVVAKLGAALTPPA